ncbi:agmatine deiminase family protein [Stratiformator vulcanicus]|uniref:Agmatine deiminase n=1 Tax=Stratiformator vulcanicus TaxID=2527980 RepID=A0A517QZK9_9PLAN|nr:agmatine deiminase family protein [Stratiformator vulcanicus]QDT37082.1 Putative agmatine deiminase [Stratiformator vulcanicus]
MTNPPPPQDRSYRWPAEWEPHAATWLSWPHNRNSWPGRFGRVEPVYARMVRVLATSEPVHINVTDAAMERRARHYLSLAGADGEITFHYIPTNDAWCRDHGAVILKEEGPGTGDRLALDFRFNAWGGKYPYDLDDAVAPQMAETLGIPSKSADFVLEGGAIDGNGQGTLLTTEACLLNSNRNPQLSKQDIEERFRLDLGVEQIIWLGDGIAGDDTDGHIDDITRFVSEDTVVSMVEPNTADENHRPLADNIERLRDVRLTDGRKLRILELPSPPPLVYQNQRVPASYANFYIANSVVLMPGYHPSTDLLAAEVLASCFPKRDVVTIDCRDLIWGLGAFHCLTQQIPR